MNLSHIFLDKIGNLMYNPLKYNILRDYQMDCSFIAYGAAKGFSCMNDKNYEKIKGFYCSDSGTKMKVCKYSDNSVGYHFLMYPQKGAQFCDKDGRSGSFFGMSLFFKDNYCKNPQKIFKMFETIYDKSVKNKLIKEFDNKNRRYAIDSFSNLKLEEYMSRAFLDVMQSPEYCFSPQDFAPFKFEKTDKGVWKLNITEANAFISNKIKSPQNIEFSRDNPLYLRHQNSKQR